LKGVVTKMQIRCVLGRFNFLSWKADCYNIIFVPYDGAAAMIIARDLDRIEMEELLKGLNNELDTTVDNLKRAI